MATAISRSPLRRLAGAISSLLGSLLVAGLIVVGSAGTAHAEDGYLYWNYHHLAGDIWKFSQVGPGGYTPEDGAVEAFRFGASATSDTDGVPARVDLAEVNFDTICEGQQPAAGEKRVAVVIDYGTAADADGTTPPEPRAACAVVAADAKTAQVLDTVADVRSEKGLTCALDGYPVKGCGDPVTDVQPADEQPVAFDLPGSDTDTGDAVDPAASDEAAEDGGLLWPLVGVGVLVLVLAGAALALSRRNRAA